MSIVSNLVVFTIIKILTTPWIKTDAYKYGLIDEKGKRTDKKPETKEEKNSLNSLNRLVFNIKRFLDKLPGGKFTTYTTAALLLLKEKYNLTDGDMKLIKEEIVNSVGSTGVENNSKNMNPMSLVKRKIQPDDMFDDYAVFDVDNDTYYKNLGPKEKYKRWKKTLSIDENIEGLGKNSHIYEYHKQNPKKGIIIRKEGTNIMRVIHEKKKK